MRKILEQDNICDSLKGRIQYFQTCYRGAHDQTSRIAIRLDGEEIFRSSYFDWAKKQYMALCELRESADGEKYRTAFYEETNHLASGQGGIPSFLSSFYNYHNSSIDKNLASHDPVVRLFAIMDKRVGKRRLAKLLTEVEKQPEWLQVFFKLRLEAEGIVTQVCKSLYTRGVKMNIFKIGDTDFGIGEVVLTANAEKGTISVTIKSDKDVYQQISNENSLWALGGPPRINLYELPSKDGNVEVEITEEILEDYDKYPDVYDISLVFHEHYDVYGTLIINDSCVTVKGTVDFQGDIYPLEIVAEKSK